MVRCLPRGPAPFSTLCEQFQSTCSSPVHSTPSSRMSPRPRQCASRAPSGVLVAASPAGGRPRARRGRPAVVARCPRRPGGGRGWRAPRPGVALPREPAQWAVEADGCGCALGAGAGAPAARAGGGGRGGGAGGGTGGGRPHPRRGAVVIPPAVALAVLAAPRAPRTAGKEAAARSAVTGAADRDRTRGVSGRERPGARAVIERGRRRTELVGPDVSVPRPVAEPYCTRPRPAV